MVSETFAQFLRILVVLTIVAFGITAIVTPPDPFTQLRWFGALLPVVLVGAYLLSYRNGYERLQQSAGSQ